jgi:hypothetical protein
MRDSENTDDVRVEVDHMVRKALDRRSSHGEVEAHTRDARTGTRHADDPLEGGVHRVEELDSERPGRRSS